jgi:hypothetical protein
MLEGFVRSTHAAEADKSAGGWETFRRWRRARPFWGGLLLILSGIEIFLSGNLSLGDLKVHFGPTGFLSYVVPLFLILCGSGAMATPNLRLFYGIIGSLTAVYSLIGVNLGGFLIGLLLGIIGGALAIAWSPLAVATPTAGALPTDEPETVVQAASTDGAEQVDHPSVPAEVPQHAQTSERWWDPSQAGPRHSDEEPPSPGTGSGGSHSRLIAITLVPVTLAAALVTVVRAAPPAYAAPCPPAPSASASPVPSPSPSNGRQVPAPQNGKPGSQTPGPQNGAAAGKPVPTASASPSAEPAKGGSNPLADAWNGLVGGVKKLFGGGTAATPADPAPSQSAAPSASAAPSQRPSPDPSGSASAPGARPGSSGTPKPGAQASASASATACPTLLGTVDPDQPLVSLLPGIITGSKQTMRDFKYEGVVDLPTAEGTKKALKFTMSRAVTTPFTLKTAEPNGKSTQITSSELTIEAQPGRKVAFYATKFVGTLTKVDLFGLPIKLPDLLKLFTTLTFSTDPPPPALLGLITIPEITFKDVTLELAFVHSDTLIAKGLNISEV